ncbi:MAG TPA: phosphoribosylanthranilate isomerase [Candidatus Acidoferrales bacterium]|nr:phosphoribosylanthranilate isomerase [Candidatus Acidoferrales bacterium]
MAKVRVKICGITNWRDAKSAIAGGADLLGFNFYPGSPRYVTPAKARRIVRRLPKRVSAVGVFVNEPEEKVLKIARAVGLDQLQLHGDESPAAVARLGRSFRVIKAVRVRKPFRAARLAPFKRASAILLDGFDRRVRGGTGKTFDWEIARRAKRHGRLFLAGGLTPENVAEAIRAAQPYAVDVCSGVEARPGKKDPARMKRLMQAVKETQRTGER